MPIPYGLETYFDLLATCLHTALGRNALGLYVYGSLTRDAFDARPSDLDCVALLRRRPSPPRSGHVRANGSVRGLLVRCPVVSALALPPQQSAR